MLSGKTILITGGLGRLGAPLAQFVECCGGCPIVTTRHPERAADFDAQAERTGSKARALVLKFENAAEVKSVAAEAVRLFGGINGLVNNAYAELPYRAVGDVPWSHWSDSCRIALAGAETLCAALVAARSVSRIESIVNVASIYAICAPDFSIYAADQNPSPAYYGASKAALLALTRYLAAYWGREGVRVNAVTPGGIAHDQAPDFSERYGATVPAGRMVTPEEVSSAICFLLSDAASGVTGTNLVVDAGKTIW